MSWKLIFALSMFGFAMGIATVFVIPMTREPFFWLGIFLVCAYLIAKRAPGKHFFHGLCVSLVNSVWVTGAHVLLFDRYAAGHAEEVAMAARMGSPQTMMLAMGPAVGLVFGCVLGVFAYVASKFVVAAHSEFAGW